MDLRKHARITADTQCKASFKLGGQTYKDICVTNLGAEGCCFEIPSGEAKGFKNLATLDSVELCHPSLPNQSVKAKVVWVHSKRGSELECLETGIQFSGAPEGYIHELDRYVSALLKFKPKHSV